MAIPDRGKDPGQRRRLESIAGWASAIAAALHGLAVPAHLESWWAYGLFFVFVAAAQFLFGIALLTRAINPADFGSQWRAAKDRLFWAGIIGNLLIMALYLVTRTTGLPFGPERGLVEPVGALDAASKVAELVVVGSLLRALRQPKQLQEVRH